MQFRLWLETDEIVELPIAQLLMTKDELEAAVSNIVRGYSAMTEGPVEVAFLAEFGKYQLTNGYHRMVAYLLANKTKVMARIKPGDWLPPTKKDLFFYQPQLRYKGLEDFIEPYLLKRL